MQTFGTMLIPYQRADGVAISYIMYTKQYVMKLNSTAAIPELLLVGRNATIINDHAHRLMEQIIEKEKNKKKLTF